MAKHSSRDIIQTCLFVILPAVPVMALIAVAMPKQCTAEQRKVAYGLKSDIALAEKLWTALRKRGVVGRDRINVHAFSGKPPHGTIQQVYATTVRIGDHRGRIIVKANHTKKGATVRKVYDEPNKYLSSYTVMFANAPGYDPDNNNWFWARYWTNGKITRTPEGVAVAGRIGKIAKVGCIGCHRKLGGKDLEALTSR